MFNTILNLDHSIKKDIICRLRHADTNKFCKDEKFIREFDPTISIETGTKPLKQFLKQGKLIVHCYDSTGFLETIAMNKPTMVFFHSYEFEQFRDKDVLNDYRNLERVGIVHTSPESLSYHINKIFCDINTWWYSNVIQDNINAFRLKYSDTSEFPIKTLLKKINN